MARLQQSFQQVTLKNLAIYRELNLICQAFQAAEVPLIVLKGGYLATAVYPHIGQRAMGDLDLLVPPQQLPQAATLLDKMGWQTKRPYTIESRLEHDLHLPKLRKVGSPFEVELHWNIVRPGQSNEMLPDALWPHTIPFSSAGPAASAFAFHLQLIHLIIHVAHNHQFSFDLRSLHDIALLLKKHGESVEWHRFVDLVQKWGWQRHAALVCCLICQI